MINKQIHHLNKILQFLYTNADCYKRNIANTTDDNLKMVLSTLENRRLEMIADINSEIINLGSVPKKSEISIGYAHDLYDNLKSIIGGGGTLSIINEIKRVEEMLLVLYYKSLLSDISPRTSALLLRHVDLIYNENKWIDAYASENQ